MTKSTITRERLEQLADNNTICKVSWDERIELAQIALAAMDSEPVALQLELAKVIYHFRDWNEGFPVERFKADYVISWMLANYPPAQPAPVVSAELLHTAASAIEDLLTTKDRTGACVWFDLLFRLRSAANAQPAPVVPEEKPIPNTLSMYAVDAVAAIAEVKGWNACRAAMLVNCATVESRNNAGCSPKNGLKCAAMFQEEPVTTANKFGNSPVIPDTWIPVSERMPPSRHEVLVGRWWGEKPRWCCKWATYIPGHPDAQSSGWLIPGASWTPTHWMPLPAAPQEVKGE